MQAMVDDNGPAFYAKTGAPQPGSEGSSGTSTPLAKSAPTAEPAGAATAAVTSSSKGVSTSLVRAEGEFQVAADDLWSLLTDETKIPSWSRNPAQVRPTRGIGCFAKLQNADS